jgi:DNA-binding protein H-NS
MNKKPQNMQNGMMNNKNIQINYNQHPTASRQAANRAQNISMNQVNNNTNQKTYSGRGRPPKINQ